MVGINGCGKAVAVGDKGVDAKATVDGVVAEVPVPPGPVSSGTATTPPNEVVAIRRLEPSE